MMPAPALVEIAGYAGFDFVIVDLEHGASSIETLEHMLRAADATGVEAIVRPGSASRADILRVLDAGASGVLVPHVSSAADAQAVVAAAHYPPVGGRGMAMTSRAGRYGLTTMPEHLRVAGGRTVVAVQVEDAAAIEHVHGISAVPGVDVVFIGPADLATSLGHPGDARHPEVAAAIESIRRTVLDAGTTRLGAFATDEEDAVRWTAGGAQLVALSSTSLIARRIGDAAQRLVPR